ncbi:hypothetical protein BDP27DRAFT_652535 [Rhodocollybia butyracea]|uniref:Uncharacterized protein n=1 Tax=Rhodocollybia butyracea TaxID=206335 RepID=A0A9P5PPY2_9AGAR|nr:hypothetical protein BDP27DRAFT_652535 [Rhodocollybia butyracea]
MNYTRMFPQGKAGYLFLCLNIEVRQNQTHDICWASTCKPTCSPEIYEKMMQSRFSIATREQNIFNLKEMRNDQPLGKPANPQTEDQSLGPEE